MALRCSAASSGFLSRLRSTAIVMCAGEKVGAVARTCRNSPSASLVCFRPRYARARVYRVQMFFGSRSRAFRSVSIWAAMSFPSGASPDSPASSSLTWA